MATKRNLWQPLAILAIETAIVLAVFLNRKEQGATEVLPQASAGPTAPQPMAENPEPKLSSQIFVLLKDADSKVRARVLALLAAWKPAEIKPQVGEILAKDSDVKFAGVRNLSGCSRLHWTIRQDKVENPIFQLTRF